MASRGLFAGLVVLLAVSHLSSAGLFGDSAESLTKETFGQAVESNDYIVIMFYSPKCGYSRHLMPNFESAASMMEDEEPYVKLAKIDCLEHVEIRKSQHIKKYPTIRFFRHGEPLPYHGAIKTSELQPEDIVRWIKVNTDSEVTRNLEDHHYE